MALKNDYQHFKAWVDDKGLLWLAIDRHNSSVNSLNEEVLLELDTILDEIAVDNVINSVIFYSAKKTGFIAGADISQFTSLKTADEAFNLIRQGQLVFSKLAALPKPVVAMIEGFCLGGGLELVLACRYRVAKNSHETKLGFPEVRLGLHPGWEGTIRLPALIGAPKAMKLILAGKIIGAKEAAKSGFIDAAVPGRVLKNAAIYYALNHPKPHQPNILESCTNHFLVRPLLAKTFRAELSKKVREDHYPAPFAVISNWEAYGVEGQEAILQEARSIGNLMVHPTAQNLIRVFFLRERLKGLAKGLSFKPEHVHIIGAGTMGSGIAALCALSGLTVTLQDKTKVLIATGIKKAFDIIKSKLKTANEIMLTQDRLNPDLEGWGVEKADVVIEAIIENLEAKQTLYREIEAKLKPGALLATNTSSLPLSDLSKGLSTELVGMHFFNPVDRMDLVEVVSDPDLDSNKLNDAIAFVKYINHLPVTVKSQPGFLVNRILLPYLLESMTLLEEGIFATTIDKSAKDFGMPVGPIELADRVGLDVCLLVADILRHRLGGEVPSDLRHKVAAGKLGTKSGEGFYRYKGGKIVPPTEVERATSKISKNDIIDRLILIMLNQAVACLRESIVIDSDLLDAAMIFGTGFAPFRGGPMHYAKSRGIDSIRLRLKELAGKYGERFLPDEGWQLLENSEDDFETVVSEEIH